jgi:PIN domain nuclease of toxin-antitoxin system
MIFLDAYAVLALALDEPAADEVAQLIRGGGAVLTAVNLLETADYIIRRAGIDEAEARAQLSLIVGDPVRIVPVTEEHAWRGARLRARHDDRERCAVSFADCVLLAAPGEDDSVATSDPAVAAVARAEGIGLVALPDTSGRRP